jgi:hypothetical protein
MTKWMTALIAAAALAAPASALQGFAADYSAQPSGPVTIAEIAIGEELLEKADEYGEREFDRLSGALHDDLSRELSSMGWLGTETSAAALLYVTIEDATPNRPTFRQQGGIRGLHFSSYGLGGADISAELRTANGEVLASYSYSWSSTDIRFAQYANTWTDALRTFDRFSTRLTESLASEADSGM